MDPALLAVLAAVGYNRLVRLRNEANTGWASIDVQLQRRGDLIPNLVEAVRLELDTTTVRYTNASTAHLWAESPTDRIGSDRGSMLEFTSWFNTHPPIRTRIAALEESGGFRLPERLPSDDSFAVELGLS